MQAEPLFTSVDSAAMAKLISNARRSVCYAGPGILDRPAVALAEVSCRLGPELITVCLDFDERVVRMGFGTFAAVSKLREAGIDVRSTPGFRTGLLVVDDVGYIFTPIALYLEPDERATSAPNAMRLSEKQTQEALARLSPAAKAIAIALAKDNDERKRIREQAVEVPTRTLTDSDLEAVRASLAEAPPVRFDVARQVRVFNAYLQYVELNLTGAAIDRRRLRIPDSMQNLGGGDEISNRLRTTFDLIEKGGTLSSKPLEDTLRKIRTELTRSLGKAHGRVVLKSAKPRLEQRLEELRAKLKSHQERVERDLQAHLDNSRGQIVAYYLPRVMENSPDALRGQFLSITEEVAKRWLNAELDRVFPTAGAMIQRMQLDVQYKDVTFETLNRDDFLQAIKNAFPGVDWDKAHNEFLAAGEHELSQHKLDLEDN